MLKFNKFTFPKPGYQETWVGWLDHAGFIDDSEQEMVNDELWELWEWERDLSVQV